MLPLRGLLRPLLSPQQIQQMPLEPHLLRRPRRHPPQPRPPRQQALMASQQAPKRQVKRISPQRTPQVPQRPAKAPRQPRAALPTTLKTPPARRKRASGNWFPGKNPVYLLLTSEARLYFVSVDAPDEGCCNRVAKRVGVSLCRCAARWFRCPEFWSRTTIPTSRKWSCWRLKSAVS